MKVASGVYRETALALRPHVDLYGGFDPRTWRRDIFAFPSVLEGGGKDRLLEGADHSRLDGFVLREGRVRGPGGALLCSGVSPVIRNCVFAGNGTLAPRPWQPKELHETAHDGGAIACLNGARPVIERNLFVRNFTEVGRGAAVAYSRSAGVLRENVFLENRSGLADPMRSSDGGAVSLWDWSNPEVSDNLVLNNRALARNDGGGLFAALWSAPLIRNNVIAGNYADDDGGGLFVGGQKHHYSTVPDPVPSAEQYLVRILGNFIAGNSNRAAASGALRVTMESRLLFVNNVVAENLGPARFQRSQVTVIHNTFLDPVRYEEVSEKLGPPVFANNVMNGGFVAPPGIIPVASPVRGVYSREQRTERGCEFDEEPFLLIAAESKYRPELCQTQLTVSAPPAVDLRVGRIVRVGDRWSVVARVEGDSVLVWGDLAGVRALEVVPWFRLRPGSPCIDAGDDRYGWKEDREGRARPLHGAKALRADPGAYEFAPRERR
ncbi:MAG: right-handed parallel beta-helix repeat-containing protein [Bryobacterales bacterium]|nr:right-handed parallel beta-helix repeat-containing protein [Bryobacterales bacterium]